jgi:hypothetical protein
MSTERVISYELRRVDLLRARVDAVALKYAQAFHGADRAVAAAFRESGESIEDFELAIDAYALKPTGGAIGASLALFVGVPQLGDFLYAEIRRFSTQVLTILSREAPEVRTVAMTLHGVGYGLDILEAARQQLLGVKEALSAGSYPEALEAVVIVEIREDRLQAAAAVVGQEQETTTPPKDWEPRGRLEWPIYPVAEPATSRTKTSSAIRATVNKLAGKPEKRKKVFVAMPFARSMRVVWQFGIRDPVRSVNLLCERMDKELFAGEILEQVKKSIESADLIVADITGNNPNVFLEVGYAWGRARPTLILCQKDSDGSNPTLPFDVAGHSCLYYEDAVDLAEELVRYLKGLGLAVSSD